MHDWVPAYLVIGYLWWQDQSFVISMDHDQHTDGSRGDGPRILISVLLLFGLRVGVLEGNVKHLGKILSQMMRRSSLKKDHGKIYKN